MMSILINYSILVFGLMDDSGTNFSEHYGAISAGAAEEERVQEARRHIGRRASEWTACMIDSREKSHPLNQNYECLKDLGE